MLKKKKNVFFFVVVYNTFLVFWLARCPQLCTLTKMHGLTRLLYFAAELFTSVIYVVYDWYAWLSFLWLGLRRVDDLA